MAEARRHGRVDGAMILLAFILLLLTGTANAAILYVDRDSGCPGSGTTGAPYCSIQNAFNVVNAGDSINIRDSASPYDANSVLTRGGSSGSPIIIQPDTGHNPTLRYTGSGADAGAIEIRNVSYVTVQNLNFDGSGVYTSSYAMKIQPDTTNMTNIQVLNSTFQNWGGSASNVSGSGTRAALMVGEGYCPTPCSPNVQPNGTVIRGNTFTANRQVSIFIQLALNTLIENNTITNQKCGKDSDTGLTTVGIKDDSSRDGGGTGTIIRNNLIHDFQAYTACLAEGLTNVGYDTTAGFWCDVGSANGLIEKNRIYNINQPTDTLRGQHESQGLFIEAGCTGWVVKNNVIYSIGGAGIRQRQARGTGVAANEYYNNTIYKVGYNGFEVGDSSGSDGNVLIFKNNIIQDAAVAQIAFDDSTPGTVTIDYNIYWDSGGSKIGQWGGSVLNFASWKSACSCDANSKNADPKFLGPLP
jgi:hypothetical protein